MVPEHNHYWNKGENEEKEPYLKCNCGRQIFYNRPFKDAIVKGEPDIIYPYTYCPQCGKIIRNGSSRSTKFRGFEFTAVYCRICVEVREGTHNSKKEGGD